MEQDGIILYGNTFNDPAPTEAELAQLREDAWHWNACSAKYTGSGFLKIESTTCVDADRFESMLAAREETAFTHGVLATLGVEGGVVLTGAIFYAIVRAIVESVVKGKCLKNGKD